MAKLLSKHDVVRRREYLRVYSVAVGPDVQTIGAATDVFRTRRTISFVSSAFAPWRRQIGIFLRPRRSRLRYCAGCRAGIRRQRFKSLESTVDGTKNVRSRPTVLICLQQAYDDCDTKHDWSSKSRRTKISTFSSVRGDHTAIGNNRETTSNGLPNGFHETKGFCKTIAKTSQVRISHTHTHTTTVNRTLIFQCLFYENTLSFCILKMSCINIYKYVV